jgi:phospholipid/cholesterol/gamma-HCH transport system substrate-binding protein
MALFSRRKKGARDPGMSPFRAGLLAIVVIGVLAFFGFTKINPFASPYKLQAAFNTANNLKPRSPVRIAGVEVGKVTKVEPIPGSGTKGAAKVTMEIRKKGLPIHKDAQLKIRQRVFLEGNFFVDILPGSPSAPILKDGSTIPFTQTSAPVQFGQLLTALQSDTREDLKIFLREFSKGLSGKGARGFNDSIKYWEAAYKNSSLANDATLGEEPTKDLQRVLKGQQKTFAALDSDEEALKGLVTNFNITAGAFAREDVALEASIPALDATLRVARPALFSLNAALPSLRGFARDALPGVRSSNPTLKASLPFIKQARKLVSRRELRGTAAVLRRYIPSFVRLNNTSVQLSIQGRQLSACTNNVLVPFTDLKVPDPDFPDNNNKHAREPIQQALPGLSGESRLSDGNNQFFHVSVAATPPLPGEFKVRPGPPTDGGSMPLEHRPDIPCETQELPNLHAPGGPATSFPSSGASVSSAHSRVSASTAARYREAFAAALPKAAREAKIKTARDAREKQRSKKAKESGR